jgi:hypothetical protein
MEVETAATLEVKRPLSYAEIVASNPAIHSSDENVATTTTHQPTQQQSNTLPRLKKRGRGGGNYGAGSTR